nr:immunoglobulin light chain junction region [Macaca mulatta]
CQRDYTTPWTF